MAFAVFAPFQPEFGTFVCGMRVYMSGVEIIEIWGISRVFGYWGILLPLYPEGLIRHNHRAVSGFFWSRAALFCAFPCGEA